MAIIVAVSGWKGSGKDTASDYLIEKHGFKKISFASPLKDTVSEQFKISRESIDLQETKEKPILSLPVYCKDKFSLNLNQFLYKEFRGADGQAPLGYRIRSSTGQMYGVLDDIGNETPLYWTPRALCILEGSAKRCADADYWVSKAAQKCDDLNGLYVISDLRFRSELSGLKKNLRSDDRVVTIRVNRFDSSPSSDPSERDMDTEQFDFIIDNKQSLEAFKEKLDLVIKSILKGDYAS